MIWGYGGVVRSFLSAGFWVPLARLSFGAYLWQSVVIVRNSKSSPRPLSLDTNSLTHSRIDTTLLTLGSLLSTAHFRLPSPIPLGVRDVTVI